MSFFYYFERFNQKLLHFKAASTTTTAPPPSQFYSFNEDLKIKILKNVLAQAIVPICSTAVWNQTFATLAGSLSNAGATSTLFNRPIDIGFDGQRNMYIVDLNNHRVQRFSPGCHETIK